MENPVPVTHVPLTNVQDAEKHHTDGEAHKHSEHLDNDLSKQIKSRECVYHPRDWVLSKLEQIKTTSSLSVDTNVVPESVKATENILSMDIKDSSNKHTTMELHFFVDGIIKFNCVNPHNPSKFSFELVDKPANLTPYKINNNLNLQTQRAEVTMPEVQVKVAVEFSPFTVTMISTKSDTEEVIFQVNANKSLRFDDNLTADFTFSTEYLYGLPERTSQLLLEDTKAEKPYRFYNQDLPVFPINSKASLYGGVPMIVGRNKNSSTHVSMFWQNTSDTYVDIHRTESSATNAYWLSERGNLECYIFVSHNANLHYKSMSHVLGHCAMPQYFSLGYHQCRWSYEDQADVLGVNNNFNEYEIPCDTITLDIDHTDGCRYFTWNEEDYPDVAGMMDTVVQDGRQLVTIADPHIKLDEEYHVYQDTAKKELYIKDKDNQPFIGKCWPGDSVYLDFLNEEARDCWASQYRYDKYKKSTPNLWAWNDMNEPSVFEQPGNHMPLDNLQTFKSLSQPENTFQVEHREVHNIYGYCHHKATFDGMVKRNESQNVRPHVLSRSFFAGSQKYTTIWTGDTGASWEYLKVTVPQLLSLSLCGISNAGGDVGGFAGDPEPELAVRWYQLGTFMPYFRGHSAIETKRREPWLYSKKYLDLIRDAIKERYRLLPYWYNCFEEHCRTAVPLLRPVWFDQENETQLSNMEDQERFLVGDSLLVVPILERKQNSIQGALRGLKGRWYDYFSKKEVIDSEAEIKTGLERIGCFVKGGHIIPTYDIKTYVKSSKDARESNVNLFVGLDEEDNAQGRMYIDDGETYDYTRGKFVRKNVTFTKDTLTWTHEEGCDYKMDNRVTRVVIVGASQKFENAFLLEENKPKQKIQLIKNGNNLVAEFVALASKNWKIVLE